MQLIALASAASTSPPDPNTAVDLAFRYLTSPDEPVAVKVYSMTIIQRLSEREPVLAEELRLHLEQQIPGSDKPAFRSRARQVLAALDRAER